MQPSESRLEDGDGERAGRKGRSTEAAAAPIDPSASVPCRGKFLFKSVWLWSHGRHCACDGDAGRRSAAACPAGAIGRVRRKTTRYSKHASTPSFNLKHDLHWIISFRQSNAQVAEVGVRLLCYRPRILADEK